MTKIPIFIVALLLLMFVIWITVMIPQQTRSRALDTELVAAHETLENALRDEIAAKDELIATQDKALKEQLRFVDRLNHTLSEPQK